MPVVARGKWFQGMPLIPWLAAKTTEGAHRDEHHRHAVPRARRCSPPSSRRRTTCRADRLNVGVGVRVDAGGVRRGQRARSSSPRRHGHVRETIEIMQGIWDVKNELFEYHGEFADFELSGFGHQPLQKPGPPIYFSGLQGPEARSAKRIAKYGLAGLDRHPGLARGHHAVEGRDGARAGRARPGLPRRSSTCAA